ncbi:MAG TPA: hypothetical protein VHZ24_18720 [Pirellulales bacterium]|nr:hypothetical protein [Pirellulales bacterium]
MLLKVAAVTSAVVLAVAYVGYHASGSSRAPFIPTGSTTTLIAGSKSFGGRTELTPAAALPSEPVTGESETVLSASSVHGTQISGVPYFRELQPSHPPAAKPKPSAPQRTTLMLTSKSGVAFKPDDFPIFLSRRANEYAATAIWIDRSMLERTPVKAKPAIQVRNPPALLP